MDIGLALRNYFSLINLFYPNCRNSCFISRRLLRPPLKHTLHRKMRVLLVFVSALFLPVHGWAWEVNTHEQLTERAIETVEAHLNAYLVERWS